MTITLPKSSPVKSSPLSANLICVASMIVWSAGLPAANLVIPHVPPVALAALRNLLAAAFLLPIWVALEGFQPMLRANWLRGIGVGFVCVGLAAVLLIIAQARTDAVTVAVITATMPVLGMALEVALDGRRMTTALIIGLGLSLSGGFLALGLGGWSVNLGLGALAAFGSTVCYTWGSRATVKSFPDLTPVGRTAITVTGAAISMSVIALVMAAFGAAPPDWAALHAREIGALLIFSVGSLGISQVLWIIGVGRLGIGLASLHLNAVPFYVMLITWALGGAWNGVQALGAVVVLIGVLVAQDLIPLKARA